jgi:hypothetical protein
MMLWHPFTMFPPCVRWALLALGTSALPACGPGNERPGSSPGAGPSVASARALVRPYVARNGLSAPAGRGGSGAVAPGPTAVVLGHRSADGTLHVGCVDSEDGAEALVRATEEAR